MTSTRASAQDFTEGSLINSMTTSVTSGVTVKAIEVNGSPVTWATGKHRLFIVQKTRTKLKVEKVEVASASQSGSTVTLGTLTRRLSLTDGTDFTASGTAQSFAAGATVYLATDAQFWEQQAFIDLANTFTANQLLSSTNELQFADSATAIWDDGSDLSFKDSNNSTITLATIAAAAGADEKVAVHTGETAQFVGAANSDGFLRTGDGLSYTDGGVFVTLDVAQLKDASSSELTISSGSITRTNSHHTVDTESDASSDDLNTIAGATDGDYITITAANTARSVVIKDAADNILTADSNDFTIDDIDKSWTGRYDGSNWKEVARGDVPGTANPVQIGAITATSTGVGASSTAEANMDKTITIPADSFNDAGATLHIKAAGGCTIASGSLTIRVKLGSTAMGLIAQTATPTDEPWVIDAHITARTVGASGSLLIGGTGIFSNDNVVAIGNTLATKPAAKTIDTTGSLTLQISAQFSASDASHDADIDTFTAFLTT